MKVIPETYQSVKSFIADYKSNELIPCICANCESDIKRPKFRIQATIRNNKSVFCTALCASKSRSTLKSYNCKECNREVIRNNSSVVGNVFCGSSCAASYNNRAKPKREVGINYQNGNKVPAKYSLNNTCKCGKKIWSTSRLCKHCRLEEMKIEADEAYLNSTFKDFKEKANGVSHTYYIYIRTGARRIAARRGMDKVCKVCGYDVYTELCHIKNISEFSDDATMAEINSEDNLVYLCPNHHKELDLGLLAL